ncbi:MAG: (2Fe-2S) ferredoxin domain-containing protein [Bacteroidetes bacterium]|nr:(2Fe-2S) ferredoxin domain-containing protein [Bacteroidota bacterium]
MALVRKEIKICMGSSCFSRGNRQTLQVIQQYLKEHHLERDVILKGNHCFGECNDGPLVQIGSKVYEKVTCDTILEILEKELEAMKEG